MKRWILLLLLLSLSSNVVSEVAVRTDLFDCFKKDIQKYRIEPSWVLRYFFSMNLQEFQKSWLLLSAIIKEKSWFLLYNNQVHYNESQDRSFLIQHCKHYDTFLNNLFVCTKTEKLICSLIEVPLKTDLSIFDYWKSKGLYLAADFYAFYFDLVSVQCIEAIKNAFLNIDDSQEYYNHFQKSWDALSLLHNIFTRLVGTSYESRYADHVKKYSELRQLLNKEKAKQDAV